MLQCDCKDPASVLPTVLGSIIFDFTAASARATRNCGRGHIAAPSGFSHASHKHWKSCKKMTLIVVFYHRKFDLSFGLNSSSS